jgi:hypothetical protein
VATATGLLFVLGPALYVHLLARKSTYVLMQVVLSGYVLDHAPAICETFTINHNGGKSVISEDVRNLALQVARALDNPDTWCAGEMARDADGHPVHYDDPSAVKWCAFGHALRLGGPVDRLAAAYARRYRDLGHDNDTYGREYVRDRLLELANS